MNNDLIGVTCALLAAVVWANALIFFKQSGEKVKPLHLNLFKNTVAIVLLMITLIVLGEGFEPAREYSQGDIWILALSGFLGITIADTLFFYSLNLCGVGIVSIVNCLYSPFIILFAFFLLSETLTLLQWLGTLLILYAVFITSKHEPPRDRTRKQLIAGIIIGVIDMAAMGLGIVIAKPVIERTPILWSTLIRLVAGNLALFAFILLLPQRRRLLDLFKPSRKWKVSMPGSVLGGYLACILWIAGFKFAKASVASILNQTSIIFALILAAVILKEAFTRRKAIASLVALIGVLLVCLAQSTGAPPTLYFDSVPRLNPELRAIGNNCWLNLKPQGTAFARMYSGCCGGGGHLWYFGGAHRSYRGNDVQLYDPRANAWIQATEPEWPEVGSKDWKAMTGGGGSTSRLSPTGRPYTEHTYQQVCWQPERKKFFIVLVSSGTWEFDPVNRKWIHLINRFENPSGPRGTWAQNHVLYEPAWKAPVLFCGSGKTGIYRFDHEKRSWMRKAERPPELAWNEFYSTHVPDFNGHLISTMKKGFFKLDVVQNDLKPIEIPGPLERCQSLSYDAANRVVIALASIRLSKRMKTVVPWALDVQTMKWTELKPPKPWPEGQTTGSWAKLWYDGDHNVHLFVNDVRRDREKLFDGGVTETWAYRYK